MFFLSFPSQFSVCQSLAISYTRFYRFVHIKYKINVVQQLCVFVLNFKTRKIKRKFVHVNKFSYNHCNRCSKRFSRDCTKDNVMLQRLIPPSLRVVEQTQVFDVFKCDTKWFRLRLHFAARVSRKFFRYCVDTGNGLAIIDEQPCVLRLSTAFLWCWI